MFKIVAQNIHRFNDAEMEQIFLITFQISKTVKFSMQNYTQNYTMQKQSPSVCALLYVN